VLAINLDIGDIVLENGGDIDLKAELSVSGRLLAILVMDKVLFQAA
jgi:hypothetical protein